MARITEQDVVLYYISHVTRECKSAYKGMELEDRIAEGTIAIVHAIRTYRTHYGSFEDYMLTQVRSILRQKNKEAWTAKKMESIFSIDSPLFPNDASPTMHDFLKEIPYDDTILDVSCFMDQLSLIERKVILLLLEEHNFKKVANKLTISVQQVQQIVENLQTKYKAYFIADSEKKVSSCSWSRSADCIGDTREISELSECNDFE